MFHVLLVGPCFNHLPIMIETEICYEDIVSIVRQKTNNKSYNINCFKDIVIPTTNYLKQLFNKTITYHL